MKSTDITINFDEALKELRKGNSLESVLNLFPEDRDELKPLLEMSQMFTALKKKEIPRPRKQYRFINHEFTHQEVAPVIIRGFGYFARLAAFPLSLIIVLTASAGTIHFAKTSLPGQTFFAVKKATEQIPLALTSDFSTRVQIQLELTQKRLTEAEEIVKSGTDSATKVAALNELSSQTKQTLDAVKEAGDGNNSAEEKSIIDSLSSIGKKQQALIETTSKETSPEVVAAAENLRKIFAASNENTLAVLNTEEITGTVSLISSTGIIVDGKKFNILDTTKILKGTDRVSNDAINIRSKVKVIGDNRDGKLLAKEIIILDNDSESKIDQKVTPIKSVTQIELPVDTESSSEQTFKAGFILEDPAPQLKP
jgi:hypothetical protein